MMKFDLAIIGGGPAGYVAAERAGAAGMSVVLFERRALGGVCLNEGCIPTKTLLYGAKVYRGALEAAKYGVAAQTVSFDYAKMAARKNKVVRKLVLGVGAKMKQHGVKVVTGAAMITGRGPEGIAVACGEESFTATDLLICTGSETFVPPWPGVTGNEHVVTAREMLGAKERPESLVVIGGGVIGMEFASLFSSLGSRVTVVEMMPEILGETDSAVAAMVREIYSKKGVDFRLGCRVERIEGGHVVWRDPDGNEAQAEGEKILVSIGRRPVTSGFGLETLGIRLSKNGGIQTDAQMRTNVPGVWAAGDVTGFSMLAHTASREGEVVINNLTGRPEEMRYDAVPGVVYTDPEVATVGLTLAAARARGITQAQEKILPMSYSGRFVAENEGGVGLCKIVIDETQKIIGVHMVGGPAGETIWGAAMAIEAGITIGELQKTIFPHPTVSEIIRDTLWT